ncbi:MAG: anthranilate phosphoribosyltransferase [Phycisphaerales bacterium]|nr:anthranilate phosphoribosyltransferase [Phycisphaerae bacterium]NNF43725.1 anthranilate phosphoribosyltransferase [Phycisphaerales bacterium]NNM25294.1 anthranilate phosphoribosyltransferase [Phycisphaerales bacterium]
MTPSGRSSLPNPHAEQAAPAEFERGDTTVDLTPLLKHLLAGHTLTSEQTGDAFEAMMTGRVHHGEIGALLALLATRTPTPAEILGAAQVMRRHVDPVPSSVDPAQLVDTAGTGGAPKTFNVSTAAAIVAAGAGAVVAKHGNRSRTGRGSAEVLRAIGVDVDAGRDVQRRCLEEAGVCFCFAIHHHPATRHVMPVRLALGFPTIFNLLGPLTNPAGARRQLMGVYHGRFVTPIAEALAALGTIRGLVVHSADGLDEVSISAETRVAHVEGGRVTEEVIHPDAFGLATAPRESVVARDLDHAAAMIRGVIDGSERGAPRAMTLLNAAATLLAAGIARSYAEGMTQAVASIDEGQAATRLKRLVAISAA